MRKTSLGLALGVILSCFGATQLYAAPPEEKSRWDKFREEMNKPETPASVVKKDPTLERVEALMKSGMTEAEARTYLKGHIAEQLHGQQDLNDLISKAEGLSVNTPNTDFRRRCDPKKDKGCSIM